ncbi:MAG: hypothetical protein CMI31_10530 [Opitutae bacterium]|nr:hypothetical protein [Opitutae bacterium]
MLREGATDPVIHSLAKEYARYRTIIDQRLDQCVALIRSGNKYTALELAEESPNVLDLMERLSFGGDAKWKELCEEKSIYLGPNFTDDHVDMLEGLYGEKISEDHPVFREYRTAMRSRDEQRTFKILKTILRMNPDHEAAKRHFGQLSVKILEQRLDHLDLLIREGRKDELLDIMDEVESTDWVIPPEKSTKATLWENALAVRQTYRRADSKLRCEQILVDLGQLRDAEEWKEALSLIGEFYELSQEYDLESEHAADDINAYNEFREWAEERMEEDRDARALQALVSRFKNRITEMKQAENAGGLSIENYLEFQAEINTFRKEFEDMGRSDVPPEVLMDLQKGVGWVKNRIAKQRGRTKRIWIGTVVLTVAAVVAFLIWFNFRQERSDLLDSVVAAENLQDPFKQWAFLQSFGQDEVQKKYMESKDEELQKGLASVVEKTFVNACALDTAGKQEDFLVATEGTTLSFADEPTMKRGRTDVVIKLCEGMLATNPPNLNAMWDFVQRFRDEDIAKGIKLRKVLRKRVDALLPAYEEAMKDVDRDLRSEVTRAHLSFSKERKQDIDGLIAVLTELKDLNQQPKLLQWQPLMEQEVQLTAEFPFHLYASSPEVSSLLDEIDGKIRSIQENSAIAADEYDDLTGELAKLKSRIVAAAQKFKSEAEIDNFVLNQGTFIEELGARYEKLKNKLQATEQLEVSKQLREVRTLWNTYRHLVRESSKKKIEELLVQAEEIADSLDAGRSQNPKGDLSTLGETIKKLVSFRGNQEEAFKPSFVQERRINKLVEMQGKILAKMGQGTQARGELSEATDLESYLAAMDRARQVKAYDGIALQALQEITTNRNIFSNDRGQLHRKLIFIGPEEVWGKIKTGELGVLPDDSQREYEDLSVIVSASGIRDVWRYKLNNCTPVSAGIGTGGQPKYNTKKDLLQFLLSFGQIQQEKIEEKFDETGKPVDNPVAKVMQQGNFLIGGKREGRLFESTHWGGAIKGPMLEEPQLTPESKFVQEQIERRLNSENRKVLKPLLDLLDALLLDPQISPLFKAYMHDKLFEIMSMRADEWGVRLSPYLKKDHEQLKAIMQLPLKVTDWMSPTSYQAMQAQLTTFYRPLGQRRYGSEVKFNLSFLRGLTGVNFPFAGYVDERGNPRYLDSGKPPAFVWCVSREEGKLSLERYVGSNALLFSPLLTVDKDLEAVFKKALLESGASSANRFGSLKNLVPFRYSD